MNTPPFVSGSKPLSGHALELINDRNTLLKRGYREHGNIFSLRLGYKFAAIVTGAELNQQFYQETDHALNVRSAYEFVRASIGSMFLTAATPEDALNQLPILKEIFQGRRMADYILAMDVETQRWLDGLGESGEMNLTTEMLYLTQVVIAHALIGKSFREEFGEGFWENYKRIVDAFNPLIPPHLPIPVNIRRDNARKRLQKVFLRMVNERRDNPDQYDDLITTVMTTPLKDGNLLPDELVLDTFIGLMFAGHETTAAQGPWLIVELLRHPDYLETVLEEIDAHVPVDAPITHHTLRELTYTYYGIDEITRLHPSADMQIRDVDDTLEMGSYTIPKGWQVMVNASNSHHLEEVWDEPEQFDPLRFSPDRNEGKNPFTIVGFGGGTHKCTGMNFAKNEMAVIMARLFQRYDLDLITENVGLAPGLSVSRPKDIIIRYRAK